MADNVETIIARAPKLTKTSIRYLLAVEDWKAPYEIAVQFGWPSAAGEKVKPYLGRLVGFGLVTWSRHNNTYRITDAGRAMLAEADKP